MSQYRQFVSQSPGSGMATIRLAELLILFFSAKSALSQERVEVRAGQDILLPCRYEKNDRPVRPDVFWRDKDEAHLYDIIAGKADLGSQDRRFHKRTESFPENYSRGNYSVLLRRATPDDSGLYTCYLPSLTFEHVVELQVTIALSQERVEVRAGQDILLPCCYENDRPVRPDVFWRGQEEAHLYDIIAGKADLGSQDRRFHKRTESFPENYGRGNYSVLLRRATPDDSGLYTCYLPSLGIQHVVELQVTTGRVADDTRSDGDSNRSHAAVLRFDLALLPLLGSTIFLHSITTMYHLLCY